MWQRARQKLLKSPAAVVRAHQRPPRPPRPPRPRRDRAGLAPLVLAGLAAEAMGVADSALMAAEGSVAMAVEGLVEDVGAVSGGRGVNGLAKARRNSSALMGNPRN